MLEVRQMPTVKLVDKYTIMLTKQFYDRKICSMDLHGDTLVPRVLNIIERLDKKYFKYNVQDVIRGAMCACCSCGEGKDRRMSVVEKSVLPSPRKKAPVMKYKRNEMLGIGDDNVGATTSSTGRGRGRRGGTSYGGHGSGRGRGKVRMRGGNSNWVS
ncbi:hypothetical protein FRX31_035454 [Thalictrum thalictroides]|uniref:Uncharacterized protein n=1 Tax=Thalictrum thalictroides TaxID=46969 RepID=A0A7J6UQX8_THATH|nr:hypothetical protein FRX31_035454 [Thalictrum thalictroides]